MTYTRIIEELGDRLPGLAMASRTVGSPQIRNRAHVGGNLGTASPAGDGLPPLYASDAEVEVASKGGTRRVPVTEFITGPKRNLLRPDELISAFYIPEASGPQQYAKIGTRNAMVIAVCAFGLALHPEEKRVGACVGSAAPTPVRARYAEGFIGGVLREERALGVSGRDRRRGAEALRRGGGDGRPPDNGRARYRRLQGPRRWRVGPAHTQVGLGRVPGRRWLMRLELTVNGERREAEDVWEGESLLHVLRERLGLPGTKNACEQGECGSCSVYMDGTLVCSCLVLAGQAEERESSRSRAWPRGRTAPGTAGIRRSGWCAVRVLHPGFIVATHDPAAEGTPSRTTRR